MSDDERRILQSGRLLQLQNVNLYGSLDEYRLISRTRWFPLVIVTLKLTRRVHGIISMRISQLLGRPTANAPVRAVNPQAIAQGIANDPTARPILRIARYVGQTARDYVYAFATLLKGTKFRRDEWNSYPIWDHTYARMTNERRDALVTRHLLLERQPTFSIVMSTYNSKERFLRRAIESVLQQTYPHFELVVTDDGSSDKGVLDVLNAYAVQDERVTVIASSMNGGISAATNQSIARADGDFVTFMDHDDELAPYALLHLALAINARPETKVIYTDEDWIDANENRIRVYCKPDFDPILLLGQNYMTHLLTVERALLNALGGLRSAFDGSQDWDLVLRVTESVPRDQIAHIPLVLYHWRSHEGSTAHHLRAKTWALDAGTKAVADALARRGLSAHIAEQTPEGFNVVSFAPGADAPLVTALIPTRDGAYLETCLTTLFDNTSYRNFEVVVIDNGSTSATTASVLDRFADRVRVHRDDRPFNFAQLHNDARSVCNGSVLLLLNDDTECRDPLWLNEMVGMLSLPEVGIVGKKLLYPDGRVQHGGVILGQNGVAGHVSQFEPGDTPGYFGRVRLSSEFSAVTGACLATWTHVWDKVGGFDESFAVEYNDVDYCLRVGEAGYRIAISQRAPVIHHESVTRGIPREGEAWIRSQREMGGFRQRWGARAMADPYYNPNLTLVGALFSLAIPPRVSPFYTGIE